MTHKPLQSKKIKNWRVALKRLEGAYADGTLRAYQADIQAYERWCKQKGLGVFPAKAKHIAEFVSHEAQRCSAATIKRRLAAIGKINRLIKLENPVVGEEVKLAVRRELRKKPSRPKQALGMNREIRDRLIGACDNSLTGKRDKVIIALGYDTLSRRSEIVSIDVEDISAASKGAKIIVRRSKNDQFGAGRIAHISPQAFTLLQDWLKSACIISGPIFRGIKHNRINVSALHAHSIVGCSLIACVMSNPFFTSLPGSWFFPRSQSAA